ncbi:hypothetical protein RRG08_003013 [Elysia crispata]|uniref:Uncharacterized protein n=1 Tax=Elysia crispata TaxID=231223 RepID=A0AAE0XW25_9GAST|nr:hypothetical protein RRG08_003013 [Elysia crispata]
MIRSKLKNSLAEDAEQRGVRTPWILELLSRYKPSVHLCSYCLYTSQVYISVAIVFIQAKCTSLQLLSRYKPSVHLCSYCLYTSQVYISVAVSIRKYISAAIVLYKPSVHLCSYPVMLAYISVAIVFIQAKCTSLQLLSRYKPSVHLCSYCLYTSQVYISAAILVIQTKCTSLQLFS